MLFDNDRSIDPALRYEHPPGETKGWLRKRFRKEVQQLQASRDFLSAIEKGKWAEVNALLLQDVDLDFQNERGETALHLAIVARHEPLVRFLLGQAIDYDMADDEGKTPLIYACEMGCARLVEVLLFVGAKIYQTTRKTHENALHYAVLKGNVKIAEMLIENGIDFTCKSTLHGTPLDVAQKLGNNEMIALLSKAIANDQAVIKDHMARLAAADKEERDRRHARDVIAWKNVFAAKKAAVVAAGGSPTEWWKYEDGDAGLGFDSNPLLSDDLYDDPPLKVARSYTLYGTPPRANSPIGDYGGMNFSNGSECTICSTIQIRKPTKPFCSKCGYILDDCCPGCSMTGHNYAAECSNCHANLWYLEKDMFDGVDGGNAADGADSGESETTTMCICCQSVQEKTSIYCEDCGYILDDKCPACGLQNHHFVATCRDCGADLWNEMKEDPEDPYSDDLSTWHPAWNRRDHEWSKPA